MLYFSSVRRRYSKPKLGSTPNWLTGHPVKYRRRELIRCSDRKTQKFEKRGLVAPTLVFWNVAGATDYPAVKDDTGVILLSGFNVAMFKAVMAMDVEKLRNITPAQAMLDTLLSPRYDAVA